MAFMILFFLLLCVRDFKQTNNKTFFQRTTRKSQTFPIPHELPGNPPTATHPPTQCLLSSAKKHFEKQASVSTQVLVGKGLFDLEKLPVIGPERQPHL